MAPTTKTANFGGAVDISSRQRGAQDALKDLGQIGAAPPEIKELGKTRLGVKAEKPPKLKTVPSHEYTTSGALLNPKVAFLKEAAEEDAPNYGNASSDATSCVACKTYDKRDKVMGHCEKYDFYANGNYTCDGWTSRKSKAPSQFIRLKLR